MQKVKFLNTVASFSIGMAGLIVLAPSHAQAPTQKSGALAAATAPKSTSTAASAKPAARPATGESVLPAQPLFIVQLLTGPAWEKDKAADAQAGFAEHSKNLARMRSDGLLVVGARFKDSVADKGMLIVRAATREAVLAQFESDPMVKERKFVLDVAAFNPFYDGFVARPERIGATPDSPLASLNWLAGCWYGRNERSEFREQWMRPAGGVMLGMGHSTYKGKMLSFESLRIELDATGIPVYTIKPSDQAEASFKSTRYDATTIVFENPTHDYPQKITYSLRANGMLDAKIEGMLKGREARIDFPMRRASCE
ncbi:MAG: DUF6265 family protein [Betaproteobacteria bacterium]